MPKIEKLNSSLRNAEHFRLRKRSKSHNCSAYRRKLRLRIENSLVKLMRVTQWAEGCKR